MSGRGPGREIAPVSGRSQPIVTTTNQENSHGIWIESRGTHRPSRRRRDRQRFRVGNTQLFQAVKELLYQLFAAIEQMPLPASIPTINTIATPRSTPIDAPCGASWRLFSPLGRVCRNRNGNDQHGDDSLLAAQVASRTLTLRENLRADRIWRAKPPLLLRPHKSWCESVTPAGSHRHFQALLVGARAWTPPPTPGRPAQCRLSLRARWQPSAVVRAVEAQSQQLGNFSLDFENRARGPSASLS